MKERNEIEKDNKMLNRQVSAYTAFVSLNLTSLVWLFLNAKPEWKFGLVLFNVEGLDWTGKNIWFEEVWKEKQNFPFFFFFKNKSTIQLRSHGPQIEVLQGGLNKPITLIRNKLFCAGKWVLQKCLKGICFLKQIKNLPINFFRLSILTENFLPIVYWRQSHNY